jgi:hypothetical protein
MVIKVRLIARNTYRSYMGEKGVNSTLTGGAVRLKKASVNSIPTGGAVRLISKDNSIYLINRGRCNAYAIKINGKEKIPKEILFSVISYAFQPYPHVFILCLAVLLQTALLSI